MSINEKLRSVIDLTTRVKKETNLRVFVAYFCGTFIGACLIISAWREYRQVQTCQYAALLQAEIGQITDLTSLLPLTAETAEFLPELMVNSLRDTREDLHKELFFQVFRSSKLPKDYLAQWGRFKSTLQELSSCHSWLDSQFAPPIINSESFVRLEKKQKTLKAVWGTALLENQKKAI